MVRYPPPIRDRRIRFALVGCGRIAQSHFQAFPKHADRAQLVACGVTVGEHAIAVVELAKPALLAGAVAA